MYQHYRRQLLFLIAETLNMTTCVIWSDKGKIMDNIVTWRKQKIKIMHHVLGMQKISLLPKYLKQIFSFLFICNFALDNAGTEMLERIAVAFIFSVVLLIEG